MRYSAPALYRTIFFATLLMGDGFHAASAADAPADLPAMLRFAERWQKENAPAADSEEASTEKSKRPATKRRAQPGTHERKSGLTGTMPATTAKKPVAPAVQAPTPEAGKAKEAAAVCSARNQETEKDLLQVTASLTRLQGQMSDATKVLEGAQSDLRVKAAQLGALDKENTTLKRDLAKKADGEQIMLDQLSELRNEAAQAEALFTEKSEKTAAMLEQLRRENGQLSDQVLKVQQENVQQKTQSEAVQMQLKDSLQAVTGLKNRNKNLDRQVGEAVAALNAARGQVNALTLSRSSSGTEGASPDLTALMNKSPAAVGDYATGVSFGREINNALMTNESLGIHNDSTLVLLGITDVIHKKLRLSFQDVENGLTNAQKSVRLALESTLKEQAATGQKATTAFLKKKGAVKADSGFLYRIVKAGSGDLPANEPVRVVVNESLADGTLVQDMQHSGQEIAQKLSAFPPVFREVLEKLKNHSEADVLVPPALAYGDNGYPPKIPPGATMLYTIKIIGAGNTGDSTTGR